jgi:hypothetical protein
MNHTTTLVEANKQNIEKAFDAIKKFATENDYQLKGDLKWPTNMLGIKKDLGFSSKKQEKRVKHYLTRLDKKVTMRTANRFLHFLYNNVGPFNAVGVMPAKTGPINEVPYLEYPEKELKIWAAKKAWKKAQAEAEKLRLAYRTEKGDYFKQQNVNKTAA